MNFDSLVSAIRQVHDHLTVQAGKAVNISLTLRNWAIGCYIREYEQGGEDRAAYGESLLDDLAGRLRKEGMKRVAARELRRYRQFYIVYPQIWESVTSEFRNLLSDSLLQIRIPIRASVTPKFESRGKNLVTKLSFTHLAELIPIEDPLKRTFYEVECIRGNWSVRELKRQIGSLCYERSGLSTNKEGLAALIQTNAEQAEPKLAIRDPYIFEFLGIKSMEVMGESDLEDALLDKLEAFLLELATGSVSRPDRSAFS